VPAAAASLLAARRQLAELLLQARERVSTGWTVQVEDEQPVAAQSDVRFGLRPPPRFDPLGIAAGAAQAEEAAWVLADTAAAVAAAAAAAARGV
jgi:hypothetical protein